MYVDVACPRCSRAQRILVASVGKAITCRFCGGRFATHAVGTPPPLLAETPRPPTRNHANRSAFLQQDLSVPIDVPSLEIQARRLQIDRSRDLASSLLFGLPGLALAVGAGLLQILNHNPWYVIFTILGWACLQVGFGFGVARKRFSLRILVTGAVIVVVFNVMAFGFCAAVKDFNLYLALLGASTLLTLVAVAMIRDSKGRRLRQLRNTITMAAAKKLPRPQLPDDAGPILDVLPADVPAAPRNDPHFRK